MRLGLGFHKGFLQLDQLLRIAPHGLQVLGLVGVVGCFHFGQGHLFGGVIRGADLAGPLEGEMLEHMRQAALAGRVVHIACVNKCGVAEDRRIRPLANDQGKAVGQHLGRDPLLEALQILGLRACCGQDHGQQRQCPPQKPGRISALHPISLFERRETATPAHFQASAHDRRGSNRRCKRVG